MIRRLSKISGAVVELLVFVAVSALILGFVLFLAMCGKEWGC